MMTRRFAPFFLDPVFRGIHDNFSFKTSRFFLLLFSIIAARTRRR